MRRYILAVLLILVLILLLAVIAIGRVAAPGL